MRQRQRIRRDAAQQGGGQHDGEERVARAGSIKRLGGHGGTKLTLALTDQPGACGAQVITKVFTPYGWSSSASDSLTTAMSMRGHRWQKSGLTGEG